MKISINGNKVQIGDAAKVKRKREEMTELKQWLLCPALLYRVVLGRGDRRKALALELRVDTDKRKLYKKSIKRAKELEIHFVNRGLSMDIRNRCLGCVEGSIRVWKNDFDVLISNSEFRLRRAATFKPKTKPINYC